MGVDIVGRDEELEALDGFLGPKAASGPGALVLSTRHAPRRPRDRVARIRLGLFAGAGPGGVTRRDGPGSRQEGSRLGRLRPR